MLTSENIFGYTLWVTFIDFKLLKPKVHVQLSDQFLSFDNIFFALAITQNDIKMQGYTGGLRFRWPGPGQEFFAGVILSTKSLKNLHF